MFKTKVNSVRIIINRIETGFITFIFLVINKHFSTLKEEKKVEKKIEKKIWKKVKKVEKKGKKS